MGNNDKYIQSIVTAYNKNISEEISKKALDMLKSAIRDEVYSRREGRYYSRTMQLINDIDIEYNARQGTIFLYHNPQSVGGYKSWNKKFQSSQWQKYITAHVPFWINYGHGIYDPSGRYVGYYRATSYMQRAKTLIEAELGVTVEIINL